ncbi:GNAT family N-acetyltransferase [Streptomyces rubiginosohelvolus]|uniref:GNAT family N-acetyltransferase n=1 Tax=Streptomyces rubiginosohelvolus TaxID=67362 RepID=UPI003437CDA6
MATILTDVFDADDNLLTAFPPRPTETCVGNAQAPTGGQNLRPSGRHTYPRRVSRDDPQAEEGGILTDQAQEAWADDIQTKYPGVCLQLGIDRGPHLVLFWLLLPESERGRGLGTQIMKHLITAADAHDVPITLSPSNKFGGDLDRLHTFYQRLGFAPNHYQPITKEEYAHADYDFAVTCANAAAGLTRPIRKQPPPRERPNPRHQHHTARHRRGGRSDRARRARRGHPQRGGDRLARDPPPLHRRP